jgi:hypothetical protein
MDSLFLLHLPLPRPERWRLAWEVLMAHETVHFAVDYACAWFELLYHTPVRRVFSDRMGSDLASGLFPNRSNFLYFTCREHRNERGAARPLSVLLPEGVTT